jgi:hypothetical protein
MGEITEKLKTETTSNDALATHISAYFSAYEKRHSDPNTYIKAQQDLAQLNIIDVPPTKAFTLFDIALMYVHAEIKNDQLTINFLRDLSELEPQTPGLDAMLVRLEKYKKCANALIEAQYLSQRTNGLLDWDKYKDAHLKHASASKDYIDVTKELFEGQNIFTIELHTWLSAIKEIANKKDPNKGFWISTSKLNAPENIFFFHQKMDGTLDKPDLIGYERALRRWLDLDAEFRLINKENVELAGVYDYYAIERELGRAYDYLNKLPNIYQYPPYRMLIPKPDDSLRDLVKLCVFIEKVNYSNKEKSYQAIKLFADLKFGAGELCKEFVRQSQEVVKPWKIDKGQNTKSRAFCKAFLFVAGLTLIGCGIAAAVGTFGIGSPLAFIGCTIGFGLISEALCLSLHARDEYIGSFNLRKKIITNGFIEENNMGQNELGKKFAAKKII